MIGVSRLHKHLKYCIFYVSTYVTVCMNSSGRCAAAGAHVDPGGRPRANPLTPKVSLLVAFDAEGNSEGDFENLISEFGA